MQTVKHLYKVHMINLLGWPMWLNPKSNLRLTIGTTRYYGSHFEVFHSYTSLELDRGSIGTSLMYGIGSPPKKCKDTSSIILIHRYLSTPTPKSHGLLITFSLIMYNYPMSFISLSTWSAWLAGCSKGIIPTGVAHCIIVTPQSPVKHLTFYAKLFADLIAALYYSWLLDVGARYEVI